MSYATERPAPDGLRQLRHDLLNALNVLVGAAGALARSNLTEAQRSWVRMLETTSDRLLEIANGLEAYRDGDAGGGEGQARLADLCTIAAASIGKPFDRHHLIETIAHVVGRRDDLRVLLVDDSPELARLVKLYLQGAGWDLDCVETGERAVAQATTERYDLVLMDIDLPGLDGATAAHAIRAADLARGARPTPIIALTAFAQDGTPPAAAPEPADPEIAALVPDFLANRRAEIATYRDAIAAGELARVQAAAHRMKGTGRGYGFAEISRLGEALESAAQRGDGAECARVVDELDAYLRTM